MSWDEIDKVLGNFFDKQEEAELDAFYEIPECEVLFVAGCAVRKDGYSSETLKLSVAAKTYLDTVCRNVGVKNWDVMAIHPTPNYEEDITTKELNELREIIFKKFDTATNPPKLIIPVNNLALKTLTKKSGIFNKRGKVFPLAAENTSIPVAPSYDITDVVNEPKLRQLFVQDIENAYYRFVEGQYEKWEEGYELCDTENKLFEFRDKLSSVSDISVAVDIETTGLDFIHDKITTVAISFGKDDTWVIPMYHFENNMDSSTLRLAASIIGELMANPKIEKVLHNCQFDLKFLMSLGIKDYNNIGDTKIVHSLVNENNPHGLMDIVKELFPENLESF